MKAGGALVSLKSMTYNLNHPCRVRRVLLYKVTETCSEINPGGVADHLYMGAGREVELCNCV